MTYSLVFLYRPDAQPCQSGLDPSVSPRVPCQSPGRQPAVHTSGGLHGQRIIPQGENSVPICLCTLEIPFFLIYPFPKVNPSRESCEVLPGLAGSKVQSSSWRAAGRSRGGQFHPADCRLGWCRGKVVGSC